MHSTIHPGRLVIHQTALGSTKGQLERCSRRQKPVRQMLDSIPGMIRWGVGVCVCAGWVGAAPLWEFTQMGENVKTEGWAPPVANPSNCTSYRCRNDLYLTNKSESCCEDLNCTTYKSRASQ